MLLITNTRRAASASLIIVVAVSMLYLNPIYRLVGQTAVLWIYYLTVIFSSFVGMVLSFLLWRSFHRGEVLKKIWGNFALGLLLWTLGSAIWSFGQLLGVKNLLTHPAADIAWILGSIPFAIGLFQRYRSLQMIPRRGWQLGFLSIVVILGMLVLTFVILPIVTESGYDSMFVHAIDILYPVGDLILVFMTLLIALVLIGGALSIPWSLIASGLFVAATSDLLYVYAIWEGMYQVDPISGVNLITFVINILYLSAYLIIDLGLYMQARVQSVL